MCENNITTNTSCLLPLEENAIYVLDKYYNINPNSIDVIYKKYKSIVILIRIFGASYVCKITKERTAVLSIIRLMDMGLKNIFHPEVVLTRDKDCYAYNNGHYFVLMDYVDGITAHDLFFTINEFSKVASVIGNHLSILHNILSRIENRVDIDSLMPLSSTEFYFNPHNSREPVHGDFHLGNILIKGKSLFVIDFDNMHFSSRMNDISECILHYLVISNKRVMFSRKEVFIDQLVNYYNKNSVMEYSYIEIIEYFALYHEARYTWYNKNYSTFEKCSWTNSFLDNYPYIY